MGQNPMFSIVIPTYKRVRCLNETLRSILPSRHFIREIIIVDQSDANFAKEIIALAENLKADFAPCQIQVKRLEQPSLTRARNVGLKSATCEWVIFCDDDVIFPRCLGEDLKNFLSQKKNAVLVGGVNYEGCGVAGYVGNADGKAAAGCIKKTPPHSCFRRILKTVVGRSGISATQGHVSHAVFGSFPDDLSETRPTEWAMGFFFVVNKNFVMLHGLEFDENLKKYAYAEDLDFTHRLYKIAASEQKDCLFSPEIGVWHKATREWREQPTWLQYAYFMNRVYIARKFYTSWAEHTWFVLRMCVAEIYNFILAIKEKRGRRFILCLWNCLRHRHRIKQEGWYFLVD